MHDSDRIIESIVRSCRIPSAARRREIERELRAHFEDASIAGREQGRGDEEIQTRVAASFGDPAVIARHFAWVYRRERAALRIAVFLLSTITVAVIIAAVVLAAQAGIAFGLDFPLIRMFNREHALAEILDIISTVTAYVGLISLEKLFETRRFGKSAVIVASVFIFLIAASSIAGLRPQFLIFGFGSGVFLRAIQIHLKNSTVQMGLALACFGMFGILAYGWKVAKMHSLASWMATGAAYHLMTRLATRIHHVLFARWE